MAKMKQTSKTKFRTLLLSIFTLLMACVFVFSACSNGGSTDTDDDDEETTKTDTQTFANADFEYFDDNNESYLIYTPNNWSKSSGSNALGDTASSSLAKSGIVDTSRDWEKEFTEAKSNYDTYKDTASDDIPEDVNYYTDIDNDYDIPGWDIANDAKTDDELSDSAIKDAAKAANPKTHWTNKDDVEKNGSNVLMLHNYRSDRAARGTAAKYTSSSITLTMNTAVKVSVWVKTYGMTNYKGEEVKPGDPRGAYVAINNTVGGSSQDALFVNNINTADITENNGWVQYSFYIKASTYATTNFSLVLGLGQGGGNNKLEYVDGYAFFDDVKYEVMTASEYDTATVGLTDDYTYKLNLGLENNDNKKEASKDTRYDKVYALDLSKSFTAFEPTVSTAGLTVDEYGQDIIDATGIDPKLIEQSKDSAGLTTETDITSDNDMSTLVKDAFEKYPFADENVLLLASYTGANYTAKLGNTWTLASEKYVAISFWVKTSDLQGGTGATVTLRDAMNSTTIGAVDTTTLTAVDIKDDNGTKKDIFDGWQQCFLYVENQTKNELSFTLEFSFGITTNAGATLSSYTEGFAAFAGFTEAEMTEQEYALKSTGTYAVTASLVGNYKSAKLSGGFDDVAYAPTDKIETDFADTRAYDGVYGGSTYVGGTDVVSSAKNDYAYAGLLNKAYSDYYYNNVEAIKKFVNSYTTAAVKADTWWNTILGTKTNQPLFITNPTANAVDSYGYVAKNASSISTSSYTTISYRVMVSEGAVANLYLIDTTAPDSISDVRYANAIDFKSGVSYHYDSYGNLVAKDPESDDFSSKADTLLYMQSNGLWAKTKNYTGSDLYANLANYITDEDGNLTDASDNIVYYANDGKYYRYYNESSNKYSVEVKDFSEALTEDQLNAARIQDKTSAVLSQTIVGTQENAYKWIYVNFYIANGDTTKNYRLEVWNGSRDGSVEMAANSTVIFDKVTGNSLTATTYASHLKDNMLAAYPSYANQTQIEEAYAKGTLPTTSNANIVYYNYSLYDDSDYKPYDADYDTDGTGNPYSEYDGTAYDNTVAYFTYNDGSTYNTFVDYSTVEKTINASSSDTDDDDSSTTSNGSNQNVWLLISSIILAVALIITLIAMLVRKLAEQIKKGKAIKTSNTYSNKRTRYMRKLKLAESNDYEEDADDVIPEDEEISEEEIYQVEESGDEIEESSEDKSDNE